jgi:hypothetical protein
MPAGAFYVPDLLKAGVRSFRVELVDEPPSVVAPLLQVREIRFGQRGDPMWQ